MARLTEWTSKAGLARSTAGIGFAERIESVKAGVVGAASTGLTFGAVVLINQLIAFYFEKLAGLQLDAITLNLLISWSIAALSGFLFGVTYRYIIRQDANPHLRSGAVLAFGLVRGLAQIEVNLSIQPNLLVPAVGVLESIVLFSIAQIILDWTIAQGWLRSFK